MKICGIYKITSPSNCIYIGQSLNIMSRWRGYKNHGASKQFRLNNSFKKYGYENHTFEILEECSKELLNEQEKYWIKFYNTFDTKHGMNLQEGGSTGKVSEETKRKISNSLLGNQYTKGHKLSEEHRKKLSEKRRGKPLSEKARKCLLGNQRVKGYKHTEETRKRLSEYLKGNQRTKGKKLSDEHKKKISKSSKGRPISEKLRKILEIKNKGNTYGLGNKSWSGKSHSEETKLKISNSLRETFRLKKENQNNIIT